MFNPADYRQRLANLKQYIAAEVGGDFKPQIALTLGSGGTGSFAKEINVRLIIPYQKLPRFLQTTVVGHAGQLVIGSVEKTQLIIYSGRKHFYEEAYHDDTYSNLKEIVLPVYLAQALGCQLYIATNAAGGLNLDYHPGDIMQINSHFDLFFPNVLAGPELGLANSPRFQPQNGQYSTLLRNKVQQIAVKQGYGQFFHQGVYAAVTGPTFESAADSRALRTLGIDAVGMSTVPEVITASNLAMDSLGFSLITNTVSADGTNATSHEEVQSALENPGVKARFYQVLKEFLATYSSTQ